MNITQQNSGLLFNDSEYVFTGTEIDDKLLEAELIDAAIQNESVSVPITLQPKQTAAHITVANEILFGGAAGGGKSHLIRVSAIIYCMAIPGLHVFLFRRTFKELIKNHIHTPGGFPELLKVYMDDKLVRYNKSEYIFEWVNGSMIHLCHAQWESDVYNYQGAQMPMLVIDESTHFTEKMIRFLRSRVRLGSLKISKQFKSHFPRILYCSNPGGISHRYHKRSFVDYGTRIHRATKKEGGMLRQFIPALLKDNTTLMVNDPDYASRLRGLGNDQLVDAMLSGNWDLSDSTAIPNWKNEVHVIPKSDIPITWNIYRAYDYGFSAPYAVLFYTKCNGEEFTDSEGHKRCPPKGSIIICGEIYGADEYGSGIKENVTRTARKITEKSATFARPVNPGPADNAIFDREQGPSISDRMKMNWLRSNKNPGSRIRGLGIVNDMVNEANRPTREMPGRPEQPCLYVMSHCIHTIDQLPNLQLGEDSEDVDTESEDHIYDVVRYIVLHAEHNVTVSKVQGL